MPSPPSPHPVRGRATASRALVLCLAAATAVAFAPAAAHAGIIPAPGPWPTTVAGATNPLTGSALAFNGVNSTPNAELRVWLPVGHRKRTAVTNTYGAYTVIAGRLRNRDTNHSISGAILTLAVQNVYTPADWTAVVNVQTDRHGRFRTVLAPGYHRRVALLYYPNVNSPAPVVSRRLLVRAKSRVTLIRPFHVRRDYRFDGQVSAGLVPIPTTGLLIALQVRNRSGSWITARLRRTTPTGRFRLRYTFPSSAPLKVRVSVPSQSGWLLYAGTSPVRAIHP